LKTWQKRLTASGIKLMFALLPLITLLGAYVLGSVWSSPGTPVALLSLLLAAGVACGQAVRSGSDWDAIAQRTGEKFTAILPAIVILMSIGALIGSWVLSGTIPMMVDLGIRLISQQYFILSTFLATALMSLFTGTSWGSAGTLGVAFMGISGVLGVPLEVTAGAVVSGAYFGDKLSPLSDTTNVCAIAARTPLYTHVRHLLYTVLPSFVIAACVYTWYGVGTTEAFGIGQVGHFATELQQNFRLGLPTLFPVLLVCLGMGLRWPAAPTLIGASLLACVVGITWQGFGPGDAIIALVNGFDTSMLSTAISSPLSDNFTTLVNRGGLASMAEVLLLVLSAFLLAAGLELSGALNRIVSRLLEWADTIARLTVATLISGGLLVALTSHAAVTALMMGDLFRARYRDLGLAPQNLSRNMEDSVTIVEPLMPWTVSALFMATTLGVPTTAYAPWAIFCFGGPLFALLYGLSFKRSRFGLTTINAPSDGE
jgi:NhaC family Na+:H+ antiporter